jgi:hypothetical protein
MTTGRRVLLGVWVTAIVAAAALLIARTGLPHFSRELVFWLVACAIGEVLWVRLPLGSATISMASCFNFAALLVLPLPAALATTAVATLLAEMAIMRKAPVRALFNAAQTTLAVGAAQAVFLALGGGRMPIVEMVSQLQLLPFLAAAATYYAINRVTVAVVVEIAERLTLAQSWQRNFGNVYDLLSCGAAFSLGVLLATHYASIGMAGTLLVVLPLVLACDGYRRFNQDRKTEAPAPENEKAAA